jgi:dTMP kinase
MFVAIEGIEGGGKSTLLAGLADWLRSEGHDPLITFEPGGTPVGVAIREIFLNRSIAIAPLTESFLVNAARAQHVADEIRPALAAGRFVLCDRFTDSTLAYQGYGRGVDLDSLRALCDAASGGLEPDLVLVVDLPVALARSRLRARSEGGDRIEAEGDDFHERVRQGFLKLARSPRHRILDGALDAEPLLEHARRELQEFMSRHVR